MEDNPILTAALSVVAAHYNLKQEDLKRTLSPGPGKDKATIILARGAFLYIANMYGLTSSSASRYIDLNRGNANTYHKKFLAATKWADQAKLMSRVGKAISTKTPKK